MVLLYFYLVGFIRPELYSINTIELYLMLNICVKLYTKIFHVEHTHLKVYANCIGFVLYVPTVFRGFFMLLIKVNFVF